MTHLEQRGRLAPVRAFRPVGIIPTYDNPDTIEAVVDDVLELVPHVVVVDDAGGTRARAVLDDLARRPEVSLVRRAVNGGKGAAVKDGLRFALHAGFSHGLQVDADGQHDLSSVPTMLSAAAEKPEALVLSRPSYDESAPGARRWGRLVSVFWVRVATLLDRGRIDDPMCGLRVYPLAATVPLIANTGDRMDFDPEIAVRLVWRGLEVVNVDAHVRYFEGGVSHYRAFRDNVLVAMMHARLCILRYLGLYRWM